jgi:hypothetical protein
MNAKWSVSSYFFHDHSRHSRLPARLPAEGLPTAGRPAYRRQAWQSGTKTSAETPMGYPVGLEKSNACLMKL